MKITKLEKEVNLKDKNCTLKINIKIEKEDFENYEYTGFDMVDDKDIPHILVALGRMYRGKIKNGKIAL